MRVVCLVAVATVGLLLVPLSVHGAGRATRGRCGIVEAHGWRFRVLCGPASARVHFRGRTITYEGGTCSTGAGWFEIDVGAAPVDAPTLETVSQSSEPLSFNAFRGKRTIDRSTRKRVDVEHDDAPEGDAFFIAHVGKLSASFVDAPRAHVVLNAARTAGTFSGLARNGFRDDDRPVSGSFHC
jgi:hypothetical protein